MSVNTALVFVILVGFTEDDVVCCNFADFGRSAKHTFIDRIFGGVFISAIVCQVCHTVSCKTLHSGCVGNE
jgi:hypothetical protein